MTAVVLEVVIQPPSGADTVRCVALRTCLPPMAHFMSAGGLLAWVVHVRGTVSPNRASVGPLIVTCEGATVK